MQEIWKCLRCGHVPVYPATPCPQCQGDRFQLIPQTQGADSGAGVDCLVIVVIAFCIMGYFFPQILAVVLVLCVVAITIKYISK